jgi:hypothetical protein
MYGEKKDNGFPARAMMKDESHRGMTIIYV